MALYDGFFDGIEDGTSEEGSIKYDREYGSEDFTEYFGQIVGSGVCVYNNPDSFLVRLENGSAVVATGYLFIRGYWLKNTADYPITIESGTGSYAILAHLSMSGRTIELISAPAASSYTDSLVLAIVDAAAGTIQDTRSNENLCGVIDALGSLSGKVEWAVNYIDTQVEGKLEQAEESFNAKSAELDDKIAEVAALANELVPPPIGAIKFSASEDVDPEWLLCDGSFISKTNYPELVELLGNYYPSGDKFQLISNGEVGTGITNGALYGGRMWFYSFPQKKLYGVDVEGTSPIKSINVSSTNAKFNSFLAPSTAKPLVLSIVPHLSGTGAALFLSQIIGYGGKPSNMGNDSWMNYLLLFGCEFAGTENSISLAPPFTSLKEEKENAAGVGPGDYDVYIVYDYDYCIPAVVSHLVDGEEIYYCATGDRVNTYGSSTLVSGPSWHSGDTEATLFKGPPFPGINNFPLDHCRVSFGKKNKGEVVSICSNSAINAYSYKIDSFPSGLFYAFGSRSQTPDVRASYVPLNIAGEGKAVYSFDLSKFPWVSVPGNTSWVSDTNVTLPSAARIFVDAGAYLWGKGIFMFFVGTGLIFSRTLGTDDFGYLDTTSVLGTITQFGYLDYSEDEGALYIAGQDTANKVKVAKMELDTLFDYASDGAWLPNINMDGIPAYIKAKEPEAET